MSRWYFRRKALKCFILDISVIAIPMLISYIVSGNSDGFMDVFEVMPIIPVWFILVPILSCKYIYKGYKDSEMGAFEFIKTAYKRGLSEKYLIIRGIVVIIFVGLFVLDVLYQNAPYNNSSSNTNQSNRMFPNQLNATYNNSNTNQSDRMFSNQPTPNHKQQARPGNRFCAMCKYFNGDRGCSSMEMRFGGVYAFDRNEEGSCFSMGIKVKAGDMRGCQNFISRY